MKVCVFGAAGMLGPAAIAALESDHALRLTDVKPLDTRHEFRIVDVADPRQVLDAAAGMDALVNLSVNRHDRALAHRVNTLGAYNVMKAAVAHRIRRVIQTGPQQVWTASPVDYHRDFEVTDDVPPRPGAEGWGMYTLTKHLGNEICRLFAEQHGLEVINLTFNSFRHASNTGPPGTGCSAFLVSWEDAGRAMLCALKAPPMPRPFETFLICADLPHRKVCNQKAKRLLGWQPRDNFESLWKRHPQPVERDALRTDRRGVV